jgi:hypothetical protein
MQEDVKSFAMKFIQSTGGEADPDIFEENEVWTFMSEFLDKFARTKASLSDGQIMVLRNLGAAMGLKPGSPLAHYAPALIRNFGPSPLQDEDLKLLTRYLHIQVNGGGDFESARKPPVALRPGPMGWKGKPR